MREDTLGNARFKWTLYGSVVSVCCIGFACLDVVCDALYYYCVENITHIECDSDCSRRGSHLVEPFCYGVI